MRLASPPPRALPGGGSGRGFALSRIRGNKAQGAARLPGVGPQRCRDVGVAAETQQPDHEVAQGAHHLRCGLTANLAAVFIKGDIPLSVESILNPPVASDKPEGP